MYMLPVSLISVPVYQLVSNQLLLPKNWMKCNSVDMRPPKTYVLCVAWVMIKMFFISQLQL